MKKIGDQYLQAFNSNIFSLDIKIGAFDSSGEIIDFDFAFRKPYADVQGFERIPETEFKEFLQLIFEKLKHEQICIEERQKAN